MEQTVTATFSELLATTREFDEQLLSFFAPDERLAFQVRAPSEGARKPFGVLVYISPKPEATMPTEWGSVLDAHNLIWVGALKSDNGVHVARRIGLALLGVAVAALEGPIDLDRLYLSGFSGGGRVASMMIPAYPDLFSGAVFICGANPMHAVPDKNITDLRRKPLVFLTGSGDFNLTDTRFANETFRHAGLANTQFMVIDGLGHELPHAATMDTALTALDTR